jgi:hypothetical protein
MIVLCAAAAATTAVGDSDWRAAVRMWYPLDRKDKKKATVNDVSIGYGNTVGCMCRDEKLEVQVLEVVDDWLDAE